MGYPMKVGYRTSAAAGRAGLSEALTGLGRGYEIVLSNVTPANDLTRFPMLSRRLGILRPVPLLGALGTGYALYEIWNSRNFSKMNACSTTGWGTMGAFSGGSCIFRSHLAQNHLPPSVTYTAGTIVTGPMHDCVSNGALFGMPQRLTTRFYAGGTFWDAASGDYRPKTAHFNAPLEVPESVPRWAPAANPWYLPINNPMPDYPAVPFSMSPYRTDPFPNPDPSPVPSPRPGPDRSPSPVYDPVPAFEPLPGVEPVVQPLPTPSIGGQPGVEVVVQSPSSPRWHRPPPRRTTENKTGRAGRFVWLIANLVTEAKDVLEALWKALPKQWKTRNFKAERAKWRGKGGERSTPPVATMAQDLANYFRHGDPGSNSQFWNKAVDNLIENQIEDYVHGKFGKKLGEASALSGRPVGYGAGPAL